MVLNVCFKGLFNDWLVNILEVIEKEEDQTHLYRLYLEQNFFSVTYISTVELC